MFKFYSGRGDILHIVGMHPYASLLHGYPNFIVTGVVYYLGMYPWISLHPVCGTIWDYTDAKTHL